MTQDPVLPSSYRTLWFLNVDVARRQRIERFFPQHDVIFPSIHSDADALVGRIAAVPASLVVLSQPEEIPPALVDKIRAHLPSMLLVPAFISGDDDAPGGIQLATPRPDMPAEGWSILSEPLLQAAADSEACRSRGAQLLAAWRAGQASFTALGSADPDLQMTPALADAPEGRRRIVLTGRWLNRSGQALERLAGDAREIRRQFPDAWISVISNCPAELADLAARHDTLSEIADRVSYGPWRAELAQGADLVASRDAGVCLDAWLRGLPVQPMGQALRVGVNLADWRGREGIVLAALDATLALEGGTEGGPADMMDTIARLDAIVRHGKRDPRFGQREVDRGLHKVEARRQRDDLEGAIALLRAAIDADGTDSDLWRRLGDLLADSDALDEAIAAYSHAIEIDPTQSQAYTRRALARKRRGEMTADVGEDFLRAYRNGETLEVEPLEQYFEFHWERAPVNDRLLAMYQNMAKAVTAAHPGGRIPGKNFLSRLAAMQFEAGMLDAAQKTLKNALKRGENAGGYTRLALGCGRAVGMKPVSPQRTRAFEHVEANRHMFTDLLDAADGDMIIVGNGPQELGRGSGPRIDSHAMVVRFNTYTTAFPQSHDYGTKTDLWVRMPATGYVKTDPRDACTNIMLTGSNRQNRATGLWSWVDALAQDGHQVAFIPREPFYELIGKLGKIPTAGLALAYMLYRETGPVDPARIFGCSFADDAPDGAAPYHHTDGAAAQGSRHDFDVERAFFQSIRRTDGTQYYLPGIRRRMARDIPTLSVDSPPARDPLWTIDGQAGRFDRVISVSPGMEGYSVLGRDVEVAPRAEVRAVLALPRGEPVSDAGKFPTLSGITARARTLVLGFGLGPTGQLGQQLAAHLGLPYMSVEYGLISSCHLPSEKQFNFSLMLDDLGAFFDTEHRSRLEAILDAGFGADTPALTARARAFMDRVLEHDITKYNNAPRMVLPPRSADKRRILVIDQTSGDLSIKYGQCGTYSFADMLDHAMAQPDAEVFLKPHPETLAGAKGANFDIDALRGRDGLTVLEENCNILSLMDQVDEVYVMVSGVGFEALMAGKTVRCFGVPFYAGRGLTIDMVAPARPRRPLSIEELVAGVFLQYHLWYDPETRQPTTAEACIERLIPKLPRTTGIVHDGQRGLEIDLSDAAEAAAFDALSRGRVPLELRVARDCIATGDTIADVSDGSGLIAMALADTGVFRVHAVSETATAYRKLRSIENDVIVAHQKPRGPANGHEDAAQAHRLDTLLAGEPLSFLRIAPTRRAVDILESGTALFEAETAPAHVLCRLSARELPRATQVLSRWYDGPLAVSDVEGALQLTPVDPNGAENPDAALYLFRHGSVPARKPSAKPKKTPAFRPPEGLETKIALSASIENAPFITCKGQGNRIVMGARARLGTMGAVKLEFLGNNNTFIMGKDCVVKRGHYRFGGDNMTIRFGAQTTVNGAYFLCLEGASITLGEDCMLSYEIECRTSDAHSILDAEEGARANPAADITVGDHVWIGKGAILMPGARLPSNSIVGTRALVTKSFEEENTVIAGVPARAVAQNRTWDRKLL